MVKSSRDRVFNSFSLKDNRQVVLLSPSSIIRRRPFGRWERERLSGTALATRHRLHKCYNYQPLGSRASQGRWAPRRRSTRVHGQLLPVMASLDRCPGSRDSVVYSVLVLLLKYLGSITAFYTRTKLQFARIARITHVYAACGINEREIWCSREWNNFATTRQVATRAQVLLANHLWRICWRGEPSAGGARYSRADCCRRSVVVMRGGREPASQTTWRRTVPPRGD